MKVQEIREIIKLVDQSNIGEFVFENEGTKIKLKKPKRVQYYTKQQLLQMLFKPMQL